MSRAIEKLLSGGEAAREFAAFLRPEVRNVRGDLLTRQIYELAEFLTPFCRQCDQAAAAVILKDWLDAQSDTEKA